MERSVQEHSLLVWEIERALLYMFDLQPSENGRYINPSVQKLKIALEHYKNEDPVSADRLIAAIKDAFPVIEKYVEGYVVKEKVNNLAQAHGISVSWEINRIQHSHARFRFGTPQHEDFFRWLKRETNKDFGKLSLNDQIQLLIELRSNRQFNALISEHLKKDPDFLFKMVMTSPEAFTKLISTRLAFLLKDEEIAEAICNHYPNMISEFTDQTDYLNSINSCLAKTGRSIDKMLNEPNVKEKLERLDAFSTYQSPPSDFSPGQ